MGPGITPGSLSDHLGPLRHSSSTLLPQGAWGGAAEPRAAGRSRHRRREAVGGGAAQEEAPAEPHDLHHIPTPRAGARVREVSLPRRVQPRGAGQQGQPARSPGPGKAPRSVPGRAPSPSCSRGSAESPGVHAFIAALFPLVFLALAPPEPRRSVTHLAGAPPPPLAQSVPVCRSISLLGVYLFEPKASTKTRLAR